MSPPTDDYASTFQVGLIGFGLLFVFAILVYLLVAIWPTKVSESTPVPAPAASPTSPATPKPTGAVKSNSTVVAAAPLIPTPIGQNAGQWDDGAHIFIWNATIGSDVRFLFLVALSAALGSFIQIGTSFTAFLGNRTFRRSWVWWYVLRIPIGAALALLFYFAVRGGFFTNVGNSDVNPFGIAALGGLVGMFSKQASDKLQDVFEELFKSNQDAARSDKLTTPPPTILGTVPPTITANQTSIVLTGTGFIQGSTATINAVAQTTQFVDAATLRVTLPSGLQSGDTLSVIVTNPAGGGSSSAYAIKISAE